jgi:hypothetical protein
MLSEIHATVSGAKNTVFHAVDEVHSKIESEVLELRTKLRSQAEAFEEERRELLKKVEEGVRNQVREVVVKHAKTVTDKVFNALLPVVKEGAKDPDMPVFVQSFLDDTIDAVWPDVKDEALETLFAATGVFDTHHGEPPMCYPYNLVAFLRYVMQPYDKSVWKKMKHPVWWLILLIALVPRYAIGQMWYMLIFLIIDRNDEFQLVQYIMGFKAIQFLNLGIVSSLVGSAQYYICIVQTDAPCDTIAPVERPYTLLVFIAQILLTYIAFAMIQCSIKKGGVTYQAKQTGKLSVRQQCETEQGRLSYWTNAWDSERSESIRQLVEENDHSNQRTRSRLLHLMIYDFVTFLICGGLLAWGMFGNLLSSDANISKSKGDSFRDVNWKTGMLLYWVKTLYGILSLPFFLLNLPVISSVLVHVRPTAYNPWGVTVPLLGKPDPRAPVWSSQQSPVESV